MHLTADQLRELASLADAWLSAEAPQRELLRETATASGPDFDRAFQAMIAQLSNTQAPTMLPPIPAAMRDAALLASVQQSSDVYGRALPTDDDDAARAEGMDAATFTHLGYTLTPPERTTGQMIGPYRLIKELGRGGMGVVWLAERADGQHSRQVALKMPLVENLNWLLAARFARERNILASLEHPSIARLYDAGFDQATQPYIAIEYVQGQTITEFVKEKRLKPEATAQLFIRVIEAVAHAHTQLVIHRDIKPSNILVDAKGAPHLLDFGIAKLLDDEDTHTADATQLTRLSGRALTLDYASPEQVNNASLGTASDVYSLGVVLYELLAGRRPYNPKGPTRRDLEQAILDQDPVKPSDQRLTTGDSESGKSARRMRGDLDTVVLKALRKDPKQRYATAQAFADDLKRYLAYEPIAAKPDAGWYRMGRFVRRHRVGAISSFAVLLTACLGLVTTTQEASRATREAMLKDVHAKRATAEASRALQQAARADAEAETARRERDRAEQATSSAYRASALAQLATQEAQNATVAAKKEATRAQSVQRYLSSLFEPVRLGLPNNASPKLTDLMRVGMERLENDFASDAHGGYEVALLFARTSRHAGAAGDALRLANLACDFAQKAFSDDDPRLAMALQERGRARAIVGDIHKSLSDILAAEGILKQRNILSLDHAFIVSDLGRIHSMAGRHEEAIAAQRRALALAERSPSSPTGDVADVMNSLGHAYNSAGDAETALLWQENAYRRRQAEGKLSERSSVSMLYNVANSQLSLGLWNKGAASLRLALEQIPHISGGAKHLEWSILMQSCSHSVVTDSIAQAEQHCARAAEVARTMNGESSKEYASAIAFRVAVHVWAGRYNDARRDIEASRRIFRGLQGDQTALLRQLRGSEAEMARVEGEVDAAMSSYFDALDKSDKPAQGRGAITLARLALHCKRTPTQACTPQVLERAIRSAALIPQSSPYRLPVATALALAASLDGNDAIAIDMLQAEIKRTESDFAPTHPWVGEAHVALASIAAKAQRLDLVNASRAAARLTFDHLPARHPLRRYFEETGQVGAK